MTMKRLILTIALIGTLASAIVPAFAASEITNCDSMPSSEWARCVIDQAQSGQ